MALAGDIYGVIGQYWLALAGLRRQDLSTARRALGIAFSIASLPAEFVPLLVAVLAKRRERASARAALDTLADSGWPAAIPLAAEGLEP
jgi:hypothetical protein